VRAIHFVSKRLSYLLAYGLERPSQGAKHCARNGDRIGYWSPDVDGLLCQAGAPDMLERPAHEVRQHNAYTGTDESQEKSLFQSSLPYSHGPERSGYRGWSDHDSLIELHDATIE